MDRETVLARGATDWLRWLALSSTDDRLRATWRVGLAWPVLWFAAGTVGVAGASALVPTGTAGPVTMAALGLGQAGAFGAAWLVWARYVDRRRLADHGLHVDQGWLLDLLAGLAAVLCGYAAWLAVASRAGWVTVAVGSGGASLTGLGLVFVAVGVNVWVQETVFYGVILQNAAEGLTSRGVDPPTAVAGGWTVALAIFVAKHRPATVEELAPLVVALGAFGLLFVATGELALSIGVHAGINGVASSLVGPAGTPVARPVVVADSMTGLGGALVEGAIPQLLVASTLLGGWIRWRTGGLQLATALAHRRAKDAGESPRPGLEEPERL